MGCCSCLGGPCSSSGNCHPCFAAWALQAAGLGDWSTEESSLLRPGISLSLITQIADPPACLQLHQSSNTMLPPVRSDCPPLKPTARGWRKLLEHSPYFFLQLPLSGTVSTPCKPSSSLSLFTTLLNPGAQDLTYNFRVCWVCVHPEWFRRD